MNAPNHPLIVGSRVSVRAGLPANYGTPIAQVLAVGPVNVKVRLYYDDSVHSVPHADAWTCLQPRPGIPGWPDPNNPASWEVVMDELNYQQDLGDVA